MDFLELCPRCAGYQELRKDEYGWYICCMYCGNVGYPDIEREETLSIVKPSISRPVSSDRELTAALPR